MDRKDFIKNTALGLGSLTLISSLTSCNEEESNNKNEVNEKSSKITETTSIALPLKVAELFSSRNHRLHHALWHGLRDFWNRPDKVSELAKEEITKLSWNPPRPALEWHRGGWTPLTLNGSGIDFLFMHREMILEFDNAMQKEGEDSDIGWILIPEPGLYPEFEVPPVWELPEGLKWLQRRFASVKTDDFYWSRIRWWDRQFHDHGYLRTLTLGQLGSLIETSVHNDMHMRWASQPYDPTTGNATPMGRDEADIDSKWDSVKYDFIGETYSSQVNPIFWRLHKWVDNIIDEWYKAHETNHKGEIQKIKINGITWYKSTKWVEIDNPWSAPSPHAHHDIKTMEQVSEILFPKKQGILKGGERTIETTKPMTWF
jgi:hypothetical protein